MLVALMLIRAGGHSAAEGRHLHGFRAAHHVHQPEATPNDAGAAEDGAHLLRRRVGRNVEVLWLDLEQQVAHRTAHHEGLVARLLQTCRDATRTGADALPCNTVLLEGDFEGLARFAWSAGKYALDEPFNHQIRSIFEKAGDRRMR